MAEALDVTGGRVAVDFMGGKYTVTLVVLHPESWSKGGIHGGVDLALLELDRPVTGVVPVPIFEGDSEEGKPITLVGFGQTGTFQTGIPQYDDARKPFVPIKRAGTNVITQTTKADLKTTIRPEATATDLEAGLGPGDSGGPALITVDNLIYLVGVASTSPGGGEHPGIFESYGDRDSFVRVSAHSSWIKHITQQDDNMQIPIAVAMLFGVAILFVLFRRLKACLAT